MSNYDELRLKIQNSIRGNGNGEITGFLLQEVLLAIVDAMGDGSGAGTTLVNIDTAMSDTSVNAVQNKVIKKYIDKTTSYLADDIKDNPSTYIPLKTINGQDLYGEGDIEIEGGGAEITFLEFEINTDTMELVMAYEMSDGGALGFDFKLDSNGNLIATI